METRSPRKPSIKGTEREFQFSDRAIERLPFSSESQIEYRDKTIPGLYLRVGKLSKTFLLIKRVSDLETGTRSVLRKITIGKFPSVKTAEARTIATELLGQIGRRIDPVIQRSREEEKKREEAKKKKKQEITLRKALEAYVSEKRRSGKLKRSTSESKYGYDFNLYGKELLDLPLSEITKDKVKSLVLRLIPEDPDSQERHTSIGIFLRSLAAVLRFANEEFFESSPLFENGKNPAKLAQSLLKPSVPRDRVLRKTELQVFFNYLYKKSAFMVRPDHSTTADYFLFVLFTGCRKDEAATLKWETVNLEEDTPYLSFLDTKTEARRTVFFSKGFLHELLMRRKNIEGTFVFPGPGKTGHIAEPKNLLQRFFKFHHDIPSFSVHDLRRTFTTYGLTAGNPAAVDAIIGHKPQTVTGRHYTAFTDEQKAKAMADIECVLLDACGFKMTKTNSERVFS